jgi:hypothetical protein
MIGFALALAGQAAAPLAAPEPVAVASTLTRACAPGVYLESGDPTAPQLTAMTSSPFEKRKVGNLGGFMLTGGISGLKVKSVLAGPGASVRTSVSRPTFRFCFAAPVTAPDNATGSGYVGTATEASSPADYRLVQFESKPEQRELTLAKSTMFHGIKTILADSTYRFTSIEVAPGQFRITFDYDLAPGEYGFVRGTGGAALKKPKKGQIPGIGEPGQPVYDFGVTKP